MSNPNDESPIADMFIRISSGDLETPIEGRYDELDIANYNKQLDRVTFKRIDIDNYNAPLSKEAPDVIDEIVQIANSDKEYQQDLQKDHK